MFVFFINEKKKWKKCKCLCFWWFWRYALQLELISCPFVLTVKILVDLLKMKQKQEVWKCNEDLNQKHLRKKKTNTFNNYSPSTCDITCDSIIFITYGTCAGTCDITCAFLWHLWWHMCHIFGTCDITCAKKKKIFLVSLRTPFSFRKIS